MRMHHGLGFLNLEKVLHPFQEARNDKFKEVLKVIFYPTPKSDSVPPVPDKITDDSNFLIRLSRWELKPQSLRQELLMRFDATTPWKARKSPSSLFFFLFRLEL